MSYFDIKAISNSDLKHFKKSPEHYIHYKKEGSKETEAMAFGTAFHTYVLEPSEFDKNFILLDETQKPVPGKDYRTVANKEWKEQFYIDAASANKKVITSFDMDTIKIMRDKLYSIEPAKEILEYTRNKFEQSLLWKWKDINCKGKCDIQSDLFLADLKTTQNADPVEFARTVINMEYYRQAGMYLDGDANGHISFNKLKEFYFIAIETVAPYGVSVHVCSKALIEKGVDEYRSLVEQLKACEETETWESYQFKALSRFDGIFELDLPYYLKD